jgi:hypothetical protein
MKRRRAAVAVVLLGAFLGACDIFPAETRVDDVRLAPLWQAAEAFDRESYGFSPLPRQGTVGWEKARGASYDVMLHQGGQTYRTIAFAKTSNGYRWVGEQESFRGPRVFHTVDGDQHEEITLTYETKAISGAHLDRLNILYHGEDRRLSWLNQPTLADVEPVLVEWGYRSQPTQRPSAG